MAKSIQPSLTRQLFDKAKEYSDVIDFTLGDPDYMTPRHIREAGIKAISEGKTKYSANAGIAELREAVADNIYRETGKKYDAQSETIVTVGAMEALYLSLCCIVDPGDEVIIPAPYWINYEHMTLMCGGKPIIIDTDEDHDFIASAEQIEAALTDRTAAIILNSPSNPTGMVYDKKTLEDICRLAKKHDIMILWDECYKTIVYDEKFVSILECGDIKENLVLINSCSKKYSMTGWRLGYAAAPAELIANMTKLQENIVACASLPSQYAAIEAFKDSTDDTEKMRLGFLNRRNILVEGINKIDNLSCKYPKGTFYAFVNIKDTGLDSVTFAYKLLEQKQVAVVPGITYGESCNDHIRIAYTMDEDKIIEGVTRIKEFVEGL